jgi:hypothetical protein
MHGKSRALLLKEARRTGVDRHSPAKTLFDRPMQGTATAGEIPRRRRVEKYYFIKMQCTVKGQREGARGLQYYNLG